MKPLILTSSSGSGPLASSQIAELVINFPFRFVWGPLPSPSDLEAYTAARSDSRAPDQWFHWAVRWPTYSAKVRKDLSLVEFCRSYEAIELWFDPAPNDQLKLIWLLDYLGSDPEVVAKLKLRLIDFDLLSLEPERLAKLTIPMVDVRERELETARRAWQAYRAPNPQASFDLVAGDLSALPLLRPALLDLIDELPSAATGLGATQTRLLELIGSGYASALGVIYRTWQPLGVFGTDEIRHLLAGLAHAPIPAVAGLDEALRAPAGDKHTDWHAALVRSDDLSLTEFGEDVLAGREDFSRHNPVHRWWGGTELTSDRLWRCGFVLSRPERSHA